ncbi:hypothetical protein L1887_37017 [Cichorium endivia]|nr:hypothetical protein L1887_37017 [Cichorium endivia]
MSSRLPLPSPIDGILYFPHLTAAISSKRTELFIREAELHESPIHGSDSCHSSHSCNNVNGRKCASELDVIHVFYQQRHGPGQISLYNVIKVYSVYDTEVGYVQYRRSLAALHEGRRCFLAGGGITERSCSCSNGRVIFGGIATFVQQHLFRFDRLMREYMPKLDEHFTQEIVNPRMYGIEASGLLLFSLVLSLAIWLFEFGMFFSMSLGVKIVFKVGLALHNYCHDDLVKLPTDRRRDGRTDRPTEGRTDGRTDHHHLYRINHRQQTTASVVAKHNRKNSFC